MIAINVNCPAKINLLLRVGPRYKKNGLHRIESVFCRSSLCDRLEIVLDPQSMPEPVSDDGYSVFEGRIEGITVCLRAKIYGEFDRQLRTLSKSDSAQRGLVSRDNILFRALDAFYREAGSNITKPERMFITLDKHIPMEAGLGGGSADAAGLIQTLYEYHVLGEGSSLSRVCAMTGNDVLPCMFSSPLFYNGTDIVLSESDTVSLESILIKPPQGSSTADAFRLLARPFESENDNDVLFTSERLQSFLDEIRNMKASISNDFSSPLKSVLPVLKTLDQLLPDTGSQMHSITGSGSCSFAIYKNSMDADSALLKIRKHLGDEWFVSREKIYS
jgi:4-diphosphocytidyl-2-C-methyl-D-erythritol kinase